MAVRGLSRAPELWLPAAATLGVCAHDISARQLWFDEHASWWAASIPGDVLLRLLAHVDAVLAPYYLLLRVWTATLGDSPALLRLPSVLAMAACAGLIGALGKELCSARAGLVAGLCFAAAPAVTRYGQEARPYAFVVALSVLSTLLLLRACADAKRKRGWLAYALSLVFVALAHLPALCLLPAHAVALLADPTQPFRPSARRAKPWLIAVASSLFLLAPFAWLSSTQAGQIAWNNPDYDELLRYPSELFKARRLGLAVMGLGLLALIKLTPQRLLLAVWALLPPLLFFATRASLHLFLPRYLLFTVPPWTLLAALGLEDLASRLRSPRALVVTATMLLVVSGLTSRTRKRFLVPAYDHRGAAAFIRARQQRGDAIAFAGANRTVRHARIALRYELREDAPRDVFAALSLLENADFLALDCESSAACLPAEVRRIWLVTPASADDPWAELASERAELLRSEFEVTSIGDALQANVFLLTRKLELTESP